MDPRCQMDVGQPDKELPEGTWKLLGTCHSHPVSEQGFHTFSEFD
jgi:hypothetical protein